MSEKLPNEKILYLKSAEIKKENMKKTYKILSKFVEKGIKYWYS